MSKKASRRILLAAILLSILLHLAGGRFANWPHVQPDETVERVSLHRRLVVQARPAPERPPPPRKSAARPEPRLPKATQAKPRESAPSRKRADGLLLRASSPASPLPPAAPLRPPAAVVPASPSRSPAVSGCLKPNQPAAIGNKALPVISKTAREAGTHGISRVRVMLSADGSVTEVKLTDSSQNHELDLEALAAARASTYSAATTNCKPVAGETEYAVEFVPF